MKMSKRTKDYSWRAETAAFEILRILRRDRPSNFDELTQLVTDSRLRGEDRDRQWAIAEHWCQRLNLACDWMNIAALHLAIDPNDEAAGTVAAILWHDASGQLRDNTITWKPGETKKAFLQRAAELHDAMTRRQKGEVELATNEVNSEHLEWLVRYQVGQKRFTDIAKTERHRTPTDIRKAVKGIADLLELTLRTSPAGRPRGKKDSRSRRIIRKKA